jgi:hypothetical protein
VVAPNRLATSTVSISSRRMTRSGTHHDQCHERTVRPVSVISKIPKGQGRLRQPPVEAVTRYLAGGMSQLCHSPVQRRRPEKGTGPLRPVLAWLREVRWLLGDVPVGCPATARSPGHGLRRRRRGLRTGVSERHAVSRHGRSLHADGPGLRPVTGSVRLSPAMNPARPPIDQAVQTLGLVSSHASNSKRFLGNCWTSSST